MPFVDDPGRIYTDPYDWHPDPVYRVSGGPGTYNQSIDIVNVFGGPVRFESAHDGVADYRQTVGGPFPDAGATACAWGKAHVGLDHSEADWTGDCPPLAGIPASTDFPEGDQGSAWTTSTPATDNPLALEAAHATARIAGFGLWPWTIPTYDNPYMDDATLEDAYNAAISATSPGFPWNLEVEQYYPTFLGFELAPDEDLAASSPIRTEGVSYLYDPTGWGFYGYDSGGAPIWDTGTTPDGSTLASYSGGTSSWVSPPSAWQPTQLFTDAFTNSFEVPADEYAAVIPLTLVADSIPGGLPSDNGTGGREWQWLLLRAAWQPPRFRWYRERSITPPRRLFGRSDGQTHGATRVLGGGNTPQSGNRVLGTIL